MNYLIGKLDVFVLGKWNGLKFSIELHVLGYSQTGILDWSFIGCEYYKRKPGVLNPGYWLSYSFMSTRLFLRLKYGCAFCY